MKRTKQAEKMIESINYYLKVNNVTDPYCDVMCAFQYALLKADIYEGYSFYKRKQIRDHELLVIVPKREGCDCIQFL